MVVTDPEFRVLRRIEKTYGWVAVDGQQAAGGTTGHIDVLTLPALDVLATTRLSIEDVGVGRPLLRSCADGWLYVNTAPGTVVQFTDELHERWRAATRAEVRAVAVDGKTGRAIICSPGPSRMARIVARELTAAVAVDLGGEALDAVAGEGNAWIAMADGTLACVAMADGTLVSRTPVVAADTVELDQSGPELAGCWAVRGRDDVSIVLKVFRCDGGKAVEIATHAATLKRRVSDVTLRRRSKRVVVCTTRTTFVWQYGT